MKLYQQYNQKMFVDPWRPRFQSNCHYMFNKGHIFTMDGTYTKYLLDTLGSAPVTLIFRGQPLVLGGSQSIPAALKKRVLARTAILSHVWVSGEPGGATSKWVLRLVISWLSRVGSLEVGL